MVGVALEVPGRPFEQVSPNQDASLRSASFFWRRPPGFLSESACSGSSEDCALSPLFTDLLEPGKVSSLKNVGFFHLPFITVTSL